jgi:hypothetical protein
MVVEKDIKEGRMKKIPWKTSTSPLFTQIAWHKDKWMTPPLEAFINLVYSIKENKSKQDIRNFSY